MPVILDLTPEAEEALQEAAARQGKSPEVLAMEAVIAGLKNQPIPQSLEEIKPRVALPPGKTLADMLPKSSWPGDETDEELLTALKALD